MRPLIGLTSYGIEPKDVLRRPWFGAPQAYFHAVWKAGGTPVLIPNLPEAAESYVERLDGIILVGGGDVEPARYTDASVHETVYDVDPARDAMELALLEATTARERPVLGICRGIQLINVARGGTLWQDVEAEAPWAQPHSTPDKSALFHEVAVAQRSRLADIVGASRIEANSYHHQAVRAVGDGLRPVGRTADGLVEALEAPDHPFLLAVQWHPELLLDREEHLALFRALVQTARLLRTDTHSFLQK